MVSTSLLLTLTSVEAAHEKPDSMGSNFKHIIALENNVYALWEEHKGDHFELLFRASHDYGKTFDDITVIGESKGRFDVQMAPQNNNIFVVWEDYSSSNGLDVFFTKSSDFGKTFAEAKSIVPQNEPGIFGLRQIVVTNNEVLVFFRNYHPETQETDLVLRKSGDGTSFSDGIKLFRIQNIDGNENVRIFQFGDRIYIATLQKPPSSASRTIDIMLGKFEENKVEFFKIIGITHHNSVHYLPFVYVSDDGEDIYAIWFDRNEIRENDIFFAKSNDGGKTFSNPQKLNPHSDGVTHIFSPYEAKLLVENNNVHISWIEEEHNTEKGQLFHYNFRKSNDSGKTFDKTVYPLIDPIKLYNQVRMSSNQHDQLYFVWSDFINPPYNDIALYLTKSDDGANTLEDAVEITKQNSDAILENIQDPQIALSDNNVFVAGTSVRYTHCVYFVSSEDGGKSFGDVTNLNTLADPADCLKQYAPSVKPPLKQATSGIAPYDIKCKSDRVKGYVLSLQTRNNNPVCITMKSYQDLLGRDLIRNDSFEALSLDKAKKFVISSPTFSFDGISDSLNLEIKAVRESFPPVITINGEFFSSHPGYGDRTSSKENFEDKKTRHQIIIQISQINQIHSAVIDGSWDEIKQEFITNRDKEKEGSGSVEEFNFAPTSRTVLSIGDEIHSDLVPITVTEISENVFDEITFWQFQPLGYHGDNRGIKWEILPKPFGTWEFLDENGNDVWDESKIPREMFGIPLDLHGYPVYCDGQERIDGESGHPSTIPIKSGINTVYAKSGSLGILPDSNGIYTIKFVSLFKTQVEFPAVAKVILNDTKLCVLEQPTEEASHAYYTKVVFRLD